MKKILVPTDYSDISENASRYAANLALKFDAEIFLLTIQSLPASDDANMAVELIKTIQEANEKKLSDKATELKAAFNGLKINAHFAFGITTIALNEFIQSGEFDLVVLGSKGPGGLDKFLFGSVAESITKHAPCPVLILPPTIEYTNFSKIVVPLDINYNMKESLNVIQRIMDFTKFYNADVKWLYVQTKNESNPIQDFSLTINQDEEIEISIVQSHQVEEGINRYCDEHSADLIIFVKRDYGVVEQFFHHSVFSEQLHHQTVPLMAIHY